MLRTLLNLEQKIISKKRFKNISSNQKLINLINTFDQHMFNCIFCENKNNFKIICDYDKFLFFQKTVYCKKCGLIQSNPRMSDNAIKSYYSKDFYRQIYSNSVDKDKNFNEKSNKSKKIYKLVKEIINFNPDDSVLEIGSYTGYNLLEFKNNNLNVMGIDPSLDAKNIAKKHNINVENIDISKLSKKFKLIMLINVLEHFNNPKTRLIEITKNMNYDSYLFICLPEIKNFSAGMLQQAHCHYYKKEDFFYLLSQCGLEIVKFGEYSKDHMYGIFKLGKKIRANNYSQVKLTERILINRYFKIYKIFFFTLKSIFLKIFK